MTLPIRRAREADLCPMKRLASILVTLLFIAGCSGTPEGLDESSLGEPPQSLAFQGPATIASALISDTLIADASGAECAGERIGGQLDAQKQRQIQERGTLAELGLTSTEATNLVAALFDCSDPRNGVVAGLRAAGLDATTASCIGAALDAEIFAAGMADSFSGASADDLRPLAAEFRRATTTCE